jgi:hypothetical protein
MKKWLFLRELQFWNNEKIERSQFELFQLDSEFSALYITKLQSVLEYDEHISHTSRKGNVT